MRAVRNPVDLLGVPGFLPDPATLGMVPIINDNNSLLQVCFYASRR